MKNYDLCVCGNKSYDKGLCEECIYLLRAKKSKNISVIEKFRADYNARHGVWVTYGQFVGLIDNIAMRRKDFDCRRKEKNIKKVR